MNLWFGTKNSIRLTFGNTYKKLSKSVTPLEDHWFKMFVCVNNSIEKT